MTQENRRDAAVSETIGYILLFAIVTLSMGVIYAIGYPALQSNIDANIFESAEQSFIVLQSNMNRVAFDQTPVKILKINLQSSSVAVSQGSSMTITYDGNPPLYISTGEVVFEKDDKTITYEMGSVLKSYPASGSVMVSEPPIYVSTIDNTTVTTIGLISVNGNDQASGKGITVLTLKHNSSIMDTTSAPTTVDIQINSTHAQKWEQYLEDIGFSITGTTDSSVTATRNNTMLILSRHVVDVDIS
ncbi:DUF7289 family protein [Methanolobus profundi]|uniref:Uncharacterized protein n=1 Tax=Methanolobus profundi TaxID=487685 RepID=A0A1I4SSB7_9EURY|nr:hypothetical protein [Methanolobus profundi]SFM67295.1 hypothetical protein SAMN04488696_1986 [Methanolobus profundi]